MRKHPPRRFPGYVRRILDGTRAGLGPARKLTVVEVRHERDCRLVRRQGDCDCTAEVEFRYDVDSMGRQSADPGAD